VNSGQTNYEYNVLGELTYQKDANLNISDNMVYDELGRMLKKKVDGNLFTYTYNNTGNGIGKIDTEESQSNGISNKYHFNGDGNMIQLDENIQGKVFTTKYSYLSGRLNQEEYNKTDQIKATILDYKYTASGYLSGVEDANGIGSGNNFYTCLAKNERGLTTSFDRVNADVMTRTYSKMFLPTSYSSNYYHRDFVFDNSNGNLISRKGLLPAQDESFLYDTQERLNETQLMGAPYLSMNYDANGNITNKSDIGEYMYHPTKKNALMEVTNDLSEVNSTTQDIEYDAHHNPTRIAEGDMEWTFEYGPNHQRKKVTIRNLKDESDVKYRYYTINVEYEYDQDDAIMYQVDYVSGEGELVGAVVYDGNSTTSAVYAIYTDYLGSIEVVTDEFGNVVADVSYDAWGRYRDASTWMMAEQGSFQPDKPDWLWRGYTGHEHMEEFQLINMNGRLYDPLVGRMLSPDNYVQDNTHSQNYNRYSYVLNNPLKYTDPDGEFIVTALFVGALLFTDVGYDVQKYVSTVALHVDIDLPGGGSKGVGIKTSVGVPQIAPLHARVHGGIGYYEYESHLGGSERSGLQTTYGFEAGFNIAGASQITYGQTFYNSPGKKFDQRTGHFVVGNPLLNFKFENDYFGDKGDKYRSGAGEINAFGFGVGFSVFTGEPSREFLNKQQGPFGTYIAGPSNNPDEYRAGGFYFKTPFGRFGKNSEKSRALVQNRIIHKWMTQSPYFKDLGDDNDCFYYQLGSGIGFLY
jgi:RHS repeat-associated protein